MENKYKVTDKVNVKGERLDAVVVSVFKKTNGALRYVVEFQNYNKKLLIVNEEQLSLQAF